MTNLTPETLTVLNLMRSSGLEIHLPVNPRQVPASLSWIDPALFRCYDPCPLDHAACGLFFPGSIADTAHRDRVIVGPDGTGLLSRDELISFLRAALTERGLMTLSVGKQELHPYKFMQVERNGGFRYLLSLPDQRRGFRQFFPKAFSIEPLLMFAPACLSVRSALSAGRFRPHFMPAATKLPQTGNRPFDRKTDSRMRSVTVTDKPELTLEPELTFLPKKRNDLDMEFVLVPGGTFTMGSVPGSRPRDTDENRKTVGVGSFWLQTTPVTQAQYGVLMKNNPSSVTGPDHPVQSVTVFDVLEFIRNLKTRDGFDYRLPREYEWEYACRYGNYEPDFFHDPQRLDQIAWHRANSEGRPHPVARKRPNLLGLFDLLGNVNELTGDIYVPDYDPYAARFPAELWPGSPVSVRGGSFNSPPRHVRPAARTFVVARDFSPNPGVGFRLVLDAEIQ